jgi:hypothetical protein
MLIGELDYAYPAAVFRGDGSGVTEILRDRAHGSCWARVTEPAAGITAAYLYLERRSGGEIDGVLVVEDEVAAVAEEADARLPRRIDLDDRLTSLGAFIEVADVAYAREADRAGRLALEHGNARIAAASFHVLGDFGGRTWRVRVGPTIGATTTLECRGDDGESRVLEAAVPREVLERARTEPVTVDATTRARRRFGGVRTRAVRIGLRPG